MAKVPPFSDLIAATTRSAVHLELRDTYDPETPAVRGSGWRARRARCLPARSGSDFVREHTARGVRFRRARIVSEPTSGLHPVRVRGHGRAERRRRRRGPLAATEASPGAQRPGQRLLGL